MSDYEMSDEELMIVKLEELQKENERLKAQQQPLEPLLQTIRQQEAEIIQLNSSLIEERKQNEKLLELAKNEKKLHEENEQLKKENSSLKQNLQNVTSRTESLKKQLLEATNVQLPDEALLHRVSVALNNVDVKARNIMLIHWLNLAVVAVFVVLTLVSGYLSYNASKAAEQANNAVQNGIYDDAGWSMIPGAYSNEYTTATQRPEWYSRFKQQHPEQAHY